MPIAVDRIAVFEAAPPPLMPPSPSPPAYSSSSIGKDSDECSQPGKGEGEAEEEGEVQSAYRGGGLAALEALEESLPIRRGISKFYNGKSKSFTILREAISSSASAKDLSKVENAYTRKRKNLLAYSIMYDKPQDRAPEAYQGGAPKRLASLSRYTLSPLSSSSSRSSSSISSEENELPQQFHSSRLPENSAPPKIPTPGLASCTPKTSPMSMRSFSMMDLHRLHRSNSSVRLKDKEKRD